MKGRGSKGGGKKRKSGRGARFGGVGVGGVGWDRGSQGPLSRGPAAIRAKESTEDEEEGKERGEAARTEEGEEERSRGRGGWV